MTDSPHLESGVGGASGTSAEPVRQTVLITHANPQDNLVARWFAAKLSIAGYKTWVDLRSLRGGDDFWDVIEDQLRHRTIKQIVLVSDHVNKPGVKKELALGDYIGKVLSDPSFIIPIRVSNLPHGEFPPELLRRNTLDAFPNWAVALPSLFETLEEANVPRSIADNSRFLEQIVAAQESGRLAISDESEDLLTNWFRLSTERPVLRFFKVEGTIGQVESWLTSTCIPYIQHSGLVGTFCDPVTFATAGNDPPKTVLRFSIPFSDLEQGRDVDPFPSRTEARRYVVNLLRQHWDLSMARRGLQSFEYATGRVGWFFPDGLVAGRVKRETASGREVNRQLSGKFKDRRWHLCLVAQPRMWPEPIVRIHANVALSLDGKTPLPGEQTHRVRLRLTRSWWNDKWRDMLSAGMGWLADGHNTVSIAVGDEQFGISVEPITIECPVSYDAEESRVVEELETGEIELSDELDDRNDAGLGEPDWGEEV